MHKYYRTKSIEESVEWAKKVQARKAGFVLWGRQYDTLNDIAKVFGLNTGSLRMRVVGGKTLAETVSEMLEKETILFRGREYAGISSLAAAYGHDGALINERLYIWDDAGAGIVPTYPPSEQAGICNRIRWEDVCKQAAAVPRDWDQYGLYP